MTNLTKPIKRRTKIETRNARPEEFSVTLYPNGTIGFRRARSRTEIRTTLAACYAMAVRIEWFEAQKQKKAARASKASTA